MGVLLKIVFFLLFTAAMVVGFLRLYRQLNNRIVGSATFWGVVWFSLLLLVANLLLFAGGLLVFVLAFDYLS